MEERDLPKTNGERGEPEILINAAEHGGPVVVDEPDRTVLLTEDETFVVGKPSGIDLPPANRPRKVYGGMWGPPELAVFGLALLSLLGVLVFYMVWVSPSASELEASRREATRLEAELASARANFGDITNVETHVSKLLASVDDFESYLPLAVNGRTVIYQRLNGLIYAYGLINTSGPAYAPLEPADLNQANQSEEERGRARFRSLFPGVYVTVTVEGPYQNLRRFIREIETGNEFVVISSVELAPSDSTIGDPQAAGQPDNSGIQGVDPILQGPMGPNRGMSQPQVQQQPTPRRGRTLGERVALRLEMAAYFRRQDMTLDSGPSAGEQVRPSEGQ